MTRITSIALTSVLAMSIAALTAAGAQKHQSSSKGGGKAQSSGKHQDKSSGSGKSSGQQQSKSGAKSATNHVEKHKDHGSQTAHPKNPRNPDNKSAPIGPRSLMKDVAKNPNVGPGAQGAIKNFESGGFLSSTDRQNLNDLIAGNPAGLGENDLKAVQAALDFDALSKREEQFLRLENATGERLTVWVHYNTLADKDAFEWLPTKPVDPEKALRYVVEPNATVYLADQGTRIAAARARLWAESDSGYKWLTYRDKDLKMKPAEKQDIREMGTRTLKLVGNQATGAQAAK